MQWLQEIQFLGMFTGLTWAAKLQSFRQGMNKANNLTLYRSQHFVEILIKQNCCQTENMSLCFEVMACKAFQMEKLLTIIITDIYPCWWQRKYSMSTSCYKTVSPQCFCMFFLVNVRQIKYLVNHLSDLLKQKLYIKYTWKMRYPWFDRCLELRLLNKCFIVMHMTMMLMSVLQYFK